MTYINPAKKYLPVQSAAWLKLSLTAISSSVPPVVQTLTHIHSEIWRRAFLKRSRLGFNKKSDSVSHALRPFFGLSDSRSLLFFRRMRVGTI